MVAQLCDYKLQEEVNLILFHQAFMTALWLMNIVSSLVTIVGNLLVIPSLWKSSSLSLSMKVLFLNLAVSDLAMGLFAQPMFVIITCLMLNTAQNDGHQNFDFLCPVTMTLFWYLLVLFASSSFLSVTAIALDRFLAVSLHLRYSELITPRRLIITVMLLWTTSVISATIFILLPKYNDLVSVSLEVCGLFLTTVAYFQIFRIARRHRNQIQSHLQTHSMNQARNMVRLKRSTFNTFYVFLVFVLCWVPSLTSFTVKEAWRSHSVEVSAANYLAGFIVFLHSSINPFIFCWRYQEIRKKAIAILKIIFTKEPH